MASKIRIDLDTNKSNYNIFECKQNDDLFFEAYIFENGIEKNLANANITINCTRSDGKYCIQNTNITKENNKITTTLERDFTRVAGLDKLEIVLLEENKQNTTFDFNLLVKKSVLEGSVESENTVTILEEIINVTDVARQVKEETEDLIQNGGAATTGQIAEINASLEQKAEEVDLQVLTQRMNQFVSLPEGSTSGDAELIDGRTSEFGITSFNIGENIRSFQNIILKDEDLNIDCGKWEHGTINLSNGINSINATNKYVRSIEKIKLRTGLKIKFEVFSKSYTPKLTLLYYDENDSYIKSLACENREITLEYPNIRLIYFYEGASVDVDMNDVLMTKVSTKITLNGIINKVPQLKDLLEKFTKVPQVQGTLKASEKVVDFNDYPIGYWFIDSNTESINKLVNAPLDSKYGYYELIAMPFTTNYSLQIAICTNGEKKGIFFRTFNYSTGDTQIKWTRIKSEIDITNNKYFACGDSITWGHISGNGTTESPFVRAKYPYPTVVANSLGLDLTYGAQTGCGWLQVSGNKTAKTIIDSTDFSQYNISTWGFGTNDYANNQPLGDINSATGGNTVCGAIKYCIEKAYRDNPDLVLILITPLNASHPGATGKEMTYENNYRYGTPNTQGYTLSDLCQKIVDICDMYNVPCIDNRKGSVVNLRNINNVLIDKLHFRDRSYITYGQFLSGKIGSIFRPFHW